MRQPKASNGMMDVPKSPPEVVPSEGLMDRWVQDITADTGLPLDNDSIWDIRRLADLQAQMMDAQK